MLKITTPRMTLILNQASSAVRLHKTLVQKLAMTYPTPIIMSWPTSGPDFCVVWLRKMPASGWGSLWESSSFVPWFSTFVFRNVPGTFPECVRICGLKRNSSNLDIAPKMRDSVLLKFWDSFLVTLPSNLSDMFLVDSRNGRVSWLAVPRMFLLCFSCNGCQRSFVSQCFDPFEEKMPRSY